VWQAGPLVRLTVVVEVLVLDATPELRAPLVAPLVETAPETADWELAFAMITVLDAWNDDGRHEDMGVEVGVGVEITRAVRRLLVSATRLVMGAASVLGREMPTAARAARGHHDRCTTRRGEGETLAERAAAMTPGERPGGLVRAGAVMKSGRGGELGVRCGGRGGRNTRRKVLISAHMMMRPGMTTKAAMAIGERNTLVARPAPGTTQLTRPRRRPAGKGVSGLGLASPLVVAMTTPRLSSLRLTRRCVMVAAGS
jgi:hypothetical protein